MNTDIVIVGGGIVGFSTALALQEKYPDQDICVLEKETAPAQHQSRYNSGVIHAGVYYKPGSMKARFCKEGREATEAFCEEHGITFERPGKLIVATNAKEVANLQKLHDRATQNNVEIQTVDGAQLNEFEPHIKGEAGLFSPTTGITNFSEITAKFAEIFAQRGGKIRYGTQLLNGQEGATSVTLQTNNGTIDAGHLIGCSGLHADRTVRAMGIKPDFQIVPFRGEFFEVQNPPKDLARYLIYPVPDPDRPFLGVHITRKVSGALTVGPNAVMAFQREGYRLSDVSVKDMAGSLSYGGFWKMLAQNFGTAMGELSASMSKGIYLKRVQKYCPSITMDQLKRYPAGVRAQAVGRDGSLIDDFHFMTGKRSLHVGNAPSPAATASIPIGKFIADEFSKISL